MTKIKLSDKQKDNRDMIASHSHMTPAQKRWKKYFEETQGARIKIEAYSKKPIVIPAYLETSISIMRFLIQQFELIPSNSIHHAATLYVKRKDVDRF